jgi:hypothetical protein
LDFCVRCLSFDTAKGLVGTEIDYDISYETLNSGELATVRGDCQLELRNSNRARFRFDDLAVKIVS